jgi:hypothetical protein
VLFLDQNAIILGLLSVASITLVTVGANFYKYHKDKFKEDEDEEQGEN